MRNVVVTGAFGALGSVVSRAFMERGDRVARIDMAPGNADAHANGIDIGEIDLTDPDAAAYAMERAENELGPVTVLVNVAGGFTWKTVADSGVDDWQKMFDLNILTCLNMTKAALPRLAVRKEASIINIGASGALLAGPGMAAYAASKSAVHRLTESLAAELADHDCTVNAILPTTLDTPANRAAMPGEDPRCWVAPRSVADVAIFLASSAARAINGALIPVSRGTAVPA